MKTIPFIMTLALALLVAPLAAAAPPAGKIYRIGYLGTDPPSAPVWDALLDGLRERGYSEGRNLVFERRFSEGHVERFPELAGYTDGPVARTFGWNTGTGAQPTGSLRGHLTKVSHGPTSTGG